jgi:hypothetical protein
MGKKEVYFLRATDERVTFEISGKKSNQAISVSVEENAKAQPQDIQISSYMGLRPQLRSAWLRKTKRGQHVRRTLSDILRKELEGE